MKPSRFSSMALLAALALAQAVTAAVVVPTATFGHNNFDNFGGNLTDLISGEEMNKVVANNPATWVTTTNAFATTWQANNRLNAATSDNAKIGWAAIDLGTATVGLENLFIWNLRDTPAVRAVADFNIYYATSLGTPLPTAPGGTAVVDYAFTAMNGWTKLNPSTLTLPNSNTAIGTGPEATIALGGISARYIAIEILSAKGGVSTDRVGLNEIAVTAVPEPSTAILGGIGALLLLRRRR